MSEFLVGLDLGQARDFTAMAIVERQLNEPAVLALRHLGRVPLGTPYTDIVQTVVRLFRDPRLCGAATLVVDYTGVGRAVVDMLRQAPGIEWLMPVTISAGQEVSKREDGSFSVPKKELVTSLQLAFQDRKLQIARSMRYVDLLVKELNNFKVKITPAANEVFGVWRAGQHDDLVLAVALVTWYASRHPPPSPDSCFTGGRGIIANAPEGVFLDNDFEVRFPE